jgi:hypothetical protein
MKVQICRASGLPVKYEDIPKYQEAQRVLYDKVKLHVLGEENTPLTMQEAERMQKLLTRLEKQAIKKFKTIDYISLKGTKASWLELVATHGPITLAKNSDTGELAVIIMDVDFGF